MRRGITTRFCATAVAGLLIGLGTACGGGGGSASQASFCGLVKDSKGRLGDSMDLTDAKSQREFLSIVQALQAKAPNEIKADMKALADAMTAFVQKGTVPDTTKLEAAFNNINRYSKEKCGVDLESSSNGSASARSSSNGSGSPAALGNSQICTDLASVGGTGSEDPKAAISRLRRVNPPAEIKADWKDFLDGAEAVLSGNFSDSELMQRYGLAAVAVSAYLLKECTGVSTDFLSGLSSSFS